jgi:4-diphosphocytidyl-2-C-methyl-D-erythritol kinase
VESGKWIDRIITCQGQLTLEILGKRPDGYHELRTLLQTVDLADTLILTPADLESVSGVIIRKVPLDDRNLYTGRHGCCLNTQESSVASGSITKRIPTAAGLGGGSSNAAATLALCQLWGLTPELSELATLAAESVLTSPSSSSVDLSRARRRGLSGR